MAWRFQEEEVVSYSQVDSTKDFVCTGENSPSPALDIRVAHGMRGFLTVMIYFLINLGAILRVFRPRTSLSTSLVLSLSGIAWSGAYLLFARVYSPFIFRPSFDEE